MSLATNGPILADTYRNQEGGMRQSSRRFKWQRSLVQIIQKHGKSSKHIPSPFPTHPLTFKIVLWLLLISLSVFIDVSQGDFPIRVTDFLQVFKTVSSNCYACLTDISYIWNWIFAPQLALLPHQHLYTIGNHSVLTSLSLIPLFPPAVPVVCLT